MITDIGRGRYQWYAFLARPADSEASEEKPDGSSPYLQNLFVGWSPEIHDILQATQEHEIEQRDLYDRPPSVFKPWTKGRVALLGDAIHAMMPNLGQGGCQAIEDASVIADKLEHISRRSEIEGVLSEYRDTRLTRSAAVQVRVITLTLTITVTVTVTLTVTLTLTLTLTLALTLTRASPASQATSSSAASTRR